MSRGFLCMSLHQKVFIVKYFYKFGEDVDSVWAAFQKEYERVPMPPEIFDLIPDVVSTFELTGSVTGDFYYRKSAVDGIKTEIMYSSVQDDVQEEVIETDVLEDKPAEIVEEEELEDDELGEEDADLHVVVEEEIQMLETKVDPRSLIAPGDTTADDSEESSDESSGSESGETDTDTDVSFKPSPRKITPKVTIRPIKQHQQQPQNNLESFLEDPNTENTPQSKTKRVSKNRKYSPQKFCDICKKFVRACFAEHMATHNSSRDYSCKTCNKSFQTLRYLKEHMQTHEEGKYVCEICGKTSKTKSNHNSHIKVHSMEKKFKCMLCPQKFLRPQGLRRHTLTHTGEKPYKCRHCTQEFALFMTHQMHERLHTGERPYQCHHCEKSFIGAPALNVSDREVY